MENVPDCNSCGHYHFADNKYVFVVHGIATKWATVADLNATIEDIPRDYMPPEDVKGISVEAAELA